MRCNRNTIRLKMWKMFKARFAPVSEMNPILSAMMQVTGWKKKRSLMFQDSLRVAHVLLFSINVCGEIIWADRMSPNKKYL